MEINPQNFHDSSISLRSLWQTECNFKMLRVQFKEMKNEAGVLYVKKRERKREWHAWLWAHTLKSSHSRIQGLVPRAMLSWTLPVSEGEAGSSHFVVNGSSSEAFILYRGDFHPLSLHECTKPFLTPSHTHQHTPHHQIRSIFEPFSSCHCPSLATLMRKKPGAVIYHRYTKQTFSFYAPQICNKLPETLRSFKSTLKAHLFGSASISINQNCSTYFMYLLDDFDDIWQNVMFV